MLLCSESNLCSGLQVISQRPKQATDAALDADTRSRFSLPGTDMARIAGQRRSAAQIAQAAAALERIQQKRAENRTKQINTAQSLVRDTLFAAAVY